MIPKDIKDSKNQEFIYQDFIKSSLAEDLEFPSYTESILVLPDSIRKNLTSITNLGFKTLPSSGGQVCGGIKAGINWQSSPSCGTMRDDAQK